MNKYFYIFFAFLIYSATSRAETQLSIAPSLLFFDYTELDLNDSMLNSETGTIPGIQFHLNTAINDQLSIELELTGYDGEVEYDGRTQSGLPITTTTDETLFRYGVKIITPLLDNTDISLSITHHQWKRDIQGKNGILGIFEKYQWQEISAGIKTEFRINEQNLWFAEISILRTINPKIYVDLSEADFGSTNLKLGTDTGARFQVSWVKNSSNKLNYGINAFYEIWEFGRSDTNTTSGGSSNVSIFEPRSETRHAGVQFQIGFHY